MLYTFICSFNRPSHRGGLVSDKSSGKPIRFSEPIFSATRKSALAEFRRRHNKDLANGNILNINCGRVRCYDMNGKYIDM